MLHKHLANLLLHALAILLLHAFNCSFASVSSLLHLNLYGNSSYHSSVLSGSPAGQGRGSGSLTLLPSSLALSIFRPGLSAKTVGIGIGLCFLQFHLRFRTVWLTWPGRKVLRLLLSLLLLPPPPGRLPLATPTWLAYSHGRRGSSFVSLA